MNVITIEKDLGLPPELAIVVGLCVIHKDSDEFVISLYDCWQFIADQESDAVSKLLAYFEENDDFLKTKLTDCGVGNHMLTCACFRELALLLNNEKSRAVRRYLLAAERWAHRETLKKERDLKKQNKDLLASVSRLSREREAYKVFSSVYPQVPPAEHVPGDFYEEQADKVIITKLRADKVTLKVVKSELARDKDYFMKAAEGRTVILKFLAPAFGDNLDAIRSQYKHIEFQFTTWADEINLLVEQGHNVTGLRERLMGG